MPASVLYDAATKLANMLTHILSLNMEDPGVYKDCKDAELLCSQVFLFLTQHADLKGATHPPTDPTLGWLPPDGGSIALDSDEHIKEKP